jgi:hypothetical protein
MGWWSKVKKKLKKPRVLRNVLRIHKWAFRKQSRVVAYTAPIVGAAIWGPVGAAAGTAVSQVAGKFTGWRGQKARAVRKQTLIIGGSAIGAAAVYSVAAGASAAQGPLHSTLYGAATSATPAAAAAAASSSGPASAVGTSGVGMLSKAVGSSVGTPAKSVTSPPAVAAADPGFVPGLLQTAVAAALSRDTQAAPPGIVQDAEGALQSLAGGGGGQPDAAGIGGLDSGMIMWIILALGAFMLFKK